MTLPYPIGPYGQETWGGYWNPAPTILIPGSDSSSLRVPMSAQSRNYNELIISWGQPVDLYDGIALVRSSYGPPLTLTDGVPVFGPIINPQMATPLSPPGQGLNPFDDVGLTGGVFYSYSLFLHVVSATPEWQRVGTVTAFVAAPYGIGNDMFEMLPGYYKDSDNDLFDSSDPSPLLQYVGQGPLERFLNLIGYSFDSIRTEAANGLEVFNPEKLRADALIAAAATYGFPFEPYIGWRQVRLLWSNWAFILETKGTKTGLEAFVSALTGYGAHASVSKNLMLDANNAEAFATGGEWNTTPGNSFMQRDIGYSLATPVGPTPFGTTIANFKLRAPTTGGPQDVTARDGDTSTQYTVRDTGVPVVAGSIYGYSFGAQAGSTQRNVVARIAWYDADGNHLSNSDGAQTAEAVFNSAPPWLLTGTPVCAYVVDTAPAGAVYAIPTVVVKAAANSEVHYLTAFQFELLVTLADLPTFYEIARTIYIFLQADRVNLAQNPGLENDSETWITNGNCVLSRSVAFSYSGTTSLLLTSSAPGDFGAATELTYTAPAVSPFAENDLYTFSVFVMQDPNDAFANAQAVASIRWYSDPVVQNSTTLIASQTGTTPIPVQQSTFGGAPASVTAQAPSGALSAQGVVQITGGPPISTRVYVDGALFEKNGGGLPYFDGDSDPTSGEYLWEGTAGDSPSHHYSGKPLRDARLRALLPDFLPAFSNWEIFYAQPTTP